MSDPLAIGVVPDVDAWEDEPDKFDWNGGGAPPDPAPAAEPNAPEVLPYFSGSTFASMELPVREVLATTLDGRPLFRRRMLVHVGARPGIGKTLMLTSLGTSGSLGDESLGIRWTRPINALYLDLELPAAEMQARYRSELRSRAGSDRFRLISSDSLERPLGALYAPCELVRLQEHYEWADVIVIDSASYGLPTEDDNSTTHWKACEDFLLSLRRRDKLVFTSFHLNAPGTKIRGTTAKEQCADLVALLHRPADSARKGAHFAWTWTKRRGVTAEVAKDFEAWLDPEGWRVMPLDDHERRTSLLSLLRAGMPVGEAAEEAGISKATAYRWRSEMIEAGILGKPPGWEKRQGRAR